METVEGRSPLCPSETLLDFLPKAPGVSVPRGGGAERGEHPGGAPRWVREQERDRGETMAALGSIRRLALSAPPHHEDLLNVCSLNIS